MNCGGVAKASISVLKLVISIQKIGKNSSSATAQASTPTSRVLRRRLCLSVSIGLSSVFLGEILAEHPYQDDRRDVGDDHRNQPARRSHADVELQQGLGVDQVGQVGGGVAGSAAGGGEDLRE